MSEESGRGCGLGDWEQHVDRGIGEGGLDTVKGKVAGGASGLDVGK